MEASLPASLGSNSDAVITNNKADIKSTIDGNVIFKNPDGSIKADGKFPTSVC